MNGLTKQIGSLEFTFDKSRELWVLRFRDTKQIVVTFRTSNDHLKGWCIKSDDDLNLWKQCTREHFQELQDLTNYGLDVLEALTNKHEA
jgi:hypothetical protein